MDLFFGNTAWRSYILNKKSIEEREKTLIDLYKDLLHKWFRYVLPLPFNPKENQLFHLIICSNFELGIVVTKDFYSSMTGNPKYTPNNPNAFDGFKKMHPETFRNLKGRRKPLQWRLLWETIKRHEEGICDYMCKDFNNIESDAGKIQTALKWLLDKDYLESLNIENAWKVPIDRYKLNWKTVKERLGVEAPPLLKPISSLQIK